MKVVVVVVSVVGQIQLTKLGQHRALVMYWGQDGPGRAAVCRSSKRPQHLQRQRREREREPPAAREHGEWQAYQSAKATPTRVAVRRRPSGVCGRGDRT